MLLYNKQSFLQIFVAHVATRKSCFKSVFYGRKGKICCKNTAAKSNWFDFAAVFLQHFLLQKLNLLQCLMDGPRVRSYIHAQRSNFLLRVDENCCSWPLNLTATSATTTMQQQIVEYWNSATLNDVTSNSGGSNSSTLSSWK